MAWSAVRFQAQQEPAVGGRPRGGDGDVLLAALRSGDDPEEVFRRLYDRYRGPVHACFARRGFSADECRDLVQETFLRIYRGIETFRGEARFETWLFEITQNVWRNELRNRSAAKRAAEEIDVEGGMDDVVPSDDSRPAGSSSGRESLDDLLAEERVRLLRTALEELPPQMRRCVQLRLDQDLKFREIAVLMQVSIDTIKSQLAQAKQRLRLSLGGYFGEIDFQESKRGAT